MNKIDIDLASEKLFLAKIMDIKNVCTCGTWPEPASAGVIVELAPFGPNALRAAEEQNLI